MTSGLENPADVPLWTSASKAPTGWFDRVMFDMHASSVAPWLFIAAGKTPGSQVRDGSVVYVDRTVQRNLRFSAAGLGDDEVGPLRWRVVEPSRRWQLRLDENPSGVAFDVEWRSRGRAWSQSADDVEDGDGESVPVASWADQSGVWSGWLSVDGQRRRVDGWLGQRSRVRGLGNPLTEQGLRLWGHGQFDDWTLSFGYSRPRRNAAPTVFGAIQPIGGGGRPDPIVAVQHALSFGDDADWRAVRLVFTTLSGERLLVDTDTVGNRGGHMAGGGYGGWFGTARGDVVESDRWPLRQGSRPAALAPYAGRLCRWTSRGARGGTGSGVLGVAHPRVFHYEPTLHES